MAISKIINMKDCGGHYHGKHLKRSLEYILKKEKTQDGKLAGALNCQLDFAFEQMEETKRIFGKTDKRQGYHLILSFKENEVDPDTAFLITQRFVQEYLGSKYEVVYAVHDNTEHIHSHIVFNSVSFATGRKYRYEKGDWARDIQPITNRLCQEYGLSIIDIEDAKEEWNREDKNVWNEKSEKQPVWSEMIKRDIDACIIQAASFDSFLDLMKDKGYETKQGKYLAIRPPGMTRYRRCRTLGNDYSEEQIRERVIKEDLSFYQKHRNQARPRIVKYHVKRYKRTKITGLQRRYFAKLYKSGQLKKKPFSQAWKYKDDINRMHKLQQQYLFLSGHDVRSKDELAKSLDVLSGKKKEASSEKSRAYRANQRCADIFAVYNEMEEIKYAEVEFQKGDFFFKEDHERWLLLNDALKEQGYTFEEAADLRKYYREHMIYTTAKERAVRQELNTGRSIWNEIVPNDSGKNRFKEARNNIKEEKDNVKDYPKDKKIKKYRSKQPKR